MFHVKSAFETSLRNDHHSPVQPKNVDHRKCKGFAHGRGSYKPKPDEDFFSNHETIRKSVDDTALVPKKPSNFQRKFSSFTEKSRTGRFMVESFRAKKSKPTNSISSGDCSSTDSVYTCSDWSELGSVKVRASSDRLHSQGTKSSRAKTAQERYQHHEVDDELWAEYLGREATKSENIIKRLLENGRIVQSDQEEEEIRHKNGKDKRKRRQRRRENLKKVLYDRIELKSTVNLAVQQDERKKPVPPPKPKNIEEKIYKHKRSLHVTLAQAQFAALNRKSMLLGSESVFFKDINELFSQEKELNQKESEEKKINQEKTVQKESIQNKQVGSQNVWLMHRGGIELGRKIEEQQKLQIILNSYKDHTVTVDETDVENTEADFDTNDLSKLRTLNESNILHMLRARYDSNLLHTHAGHKVLLAFNRDKLSTHRGNLETKQDPIAQIVRSVYEEMLSTCRNQSLVFLGYSGSGKTSTFKETLNYLVTSCSRNRSSNSCIVNVEKLSSVCKILELFGCCRTKNNENSSRFAQSFSLNFDGGGRVVSGKIDAFLLETRRCQNEPFFHALLLDTKHLLKSEENRGDLSKAFHTLGVTKKNQQLVWSLLGAILHLRQASVVLKTQKYNFGNQQSAQKAASFLGLTVEDLSSAIFTPKLGNTKASAQEILNSFTTQLYQQLFDLIIAVINKSLAAPNHATNCSIILVDNPGLKQRDSSSTFDDFCSNYLHERLQRFFYNANVTGPRALYIQEGVGISNNSDNEILVNSLKDTSRSLDGLLQLLEEEVACSGGGTEESFARKVFSSSVVNKRDDELLLRKASGVGEFILQHLRGTYPAQYDGGEWLKWCRERKISQSLRSVLKKSAKEEVQDLYGFGQNNKTSTGNSPSSWRFSKKPQASSTSLVKLKQSVDNLVESLASTRPAFVICLLPKRESWSETGLDIPFLRLQMRSFQILETAQIYKQGYPYSVSVNEFRRRYSPLVTSEVLSNETSVETLLSLLDLQGDNDCKIGSSQVFFRNGALARLEERLATLHGETVSKFQARCRGFLLRKSIQRRRLESVAVECLQRNVRMFLATKDWSWWRLFAKLRPLLDVTRTEQQLRLRTKELEDLKTQFAKVETERDDLKIENHRLESKLSEMTADLAEEQSTSTLATEKLDAASADRMRLERALSDVQEKNKNLRTTSERLEMELSSARSDLNSIAEAEDELETEQGDRVYKKRYERAVKELDFSRKRLQQQHEDDLEQLVALKKQLEKKLMDAYEEVEEQRQVVGQWKRKVQKLNGDMNDLKLLLEEQNARNNLLEKKQRKFDSETQLLHDELKQEKQQKERLLREKDVMLAEKFTLESHLQDVRLDLELKEEKLRALQSDMDEITFGGKTEEEVTILRRQKIDCERRLHDQHEELDDLGAQLHLLEQAKAKLEMALEQQRKGAKKEAQQHEEELEEIRSNSQKKIKALESQLEAEHEERTHLVREKHELERRLIEVLETDRNEKACDEALFHRLKRDLKRTKALLKDTQTQLDRFKTENPNKSVIRQLRNQLEDLECARNLAVKSKQNLESELLETQSQLEDLQRQKSDAEDRANGVQREKTELQMQLEENEEELAEVLKKYKTTVQQMSMDQAALQEQVCLVSELELERNRLKDQLHELSSRLETVEDGASASVVLRRGELKVKELESKLELEQTTRARLEVQINRLKDAVEKLQLDVNGARIKEHSAQEQVRKLQKALREVKEELSNSCLKESEAIQKRKELEKKYEGLETEAANLRQDLKLALKRIADLQVAIQGELDDSNSDESDSEKEHHYSSDESVNTFLLNHKVSSNSNINRTFSDSGRRSSNVSRSSTSSFIGKESNYS